VEAFSNNSSSTTLYVTAFTDPTNASAIMSSSTSASLTTGYASTSTTSMLPTNMTSTTLTMPTTTSPSTTSPKTTSPTTRTSTTVITTIHPLAREITCKKNVFFAFEIFANLINICQAGPLV
jgi:hypothetical protein